ncbi:MAG: phosphonate ABC transporter, permease protein PhnE [Chloroflexi bacterium]|nr:phosphonate ABC transporter, permease protein PhnE [Chloroflexota bacterium]
MSAAPTARPAPPPRSWIVPAGLIAFLGITVWAIGEVGLDPLAIIAGLSGADRIVSALLAPNWDFLGNTVQPMLETFQMAVIASAIGCGIALPLAFVASRVTTPNRVAYALDRSILNVVRAIPDILYALIFVSAVSVGPLAGILALVLFNIGVVAKLLSETVDGVDTGPIEAARAAGANRTQTVGTAVLPQVMPNYIAYALYTFELNIRASTVIGIVGAGGIGYLLDTQRKFFAYSNVSVIVIELFVFVFLIELISISLRRRLV